MGKEVVECVARKGNMIQIRKTVKDMLTSLQRIVNSIKKKRKMKFGNHYGLDW